MLKFIPETTELNVPILKDIAAKMGKVLTFYDLETTTFLNNPTFGITEVAAVHVHPDGKVTQQSMLVNPENPISQAASEITGISQDMVDHEPHWGAEARDYFFHWARQHVMIGFNNLSFDNKGVIDQNKRYGANDTEFTDSRDVRSIWRLMTSSPKGRLGEIAERYGINPEGAHRAIYDVRMTARVLDSMLNEAGVGLFDHPGAKLDANKKLEKLFIPTEVSAENPDGYINQEDRLLKIIEQCGYTTTKRLVLMTGLSEFNLSTLLGDMVVNDLLDYTLVEDRDAQSWLRNRVPHIIEMAWTGADRGKLKPVFETVKRQMDLGTIPLHNGTNKIPSEVDYLQLRVFLKAGGYYAAMEKSAVPLPVVKNTPDIEPPMQDSSVHLSISM